MDGRLSEEELRRMGCQPCNRCGKMPKAGTYNGGSAYIGCLCQFGGHARGLPGIEYAVQCWNQAMKGESRY